MRNRLIFFTVILVALALAGCASDDGDNADTGNDGAAVLSQCVEDAPDCEDMQTIDTDGIGDGTGGGLPPASDSGDTVSGGMIIDGGLSIDEALAYEGAEPVAVSGFFVSVDGDARLCSALAESFPPQCGGTSVVISNPDALVSHPLIEEGSTQWSDAVVTVIGTIDGDVLTIDTTSA